MKKKKPKSDIHPTIFEQKEVRRVWHNEQWYFVINDIVEALTQTLNVSDYIKKMRLRDIELGKGWGQIVTPLSVKTKGGLQKLNCGDLQGIFRIIQSIPSPKAEPFKLWLARVGQERIEEIQDPDNPRDHMSELELILTMLGEATTTEITTTRNSQGLGKLRGDAKEGGAVAGRTRQDIE